MNGNRKENAMDEFKFNVETTVIGTADGKETFEVRKQYNVEGKSAIILALYPTVSLLNPMNTDNSTNYLLNHAHELGYNDIRIINLYSTVFKAKPSTKRLHESDKNMEHIQSLLTELNPKDTDFVLAWGGSLKKNATTNLIKYKILQMLIKNGWENSIKHIITDTLEDDNQIAPHMLWLALHCASESWFVVKCPVKKILEEVSPKDDVVEVPVKNKQTRKKTAKSGE